MLPESSNVFGTISSTLTKQEVAAQFGLFGWSVWKFYSEWEIRNDYSELVIEGDKVNEFLIHGPVDPDFFNVLVEKMISMQLRFSLEFYDENKEMISVINNDMIA